MLTQPGLHLPLIASLVTSGREPWQVSWEPCGVPGWWQLGGTAAPPRVTAPSQLPAGSSDTAPLHGTFESSVTRVEMTCHLSILHICGIFFNVLPLLNVFVPRQPYCLLSTLYSTKTSRLFLVSSFGDNLVSFPAFLSFVEQ